MDIKLELLKHYISGLVIDTIQNEIDIGKIADTAAIDLLQKIQAVIKDEDFSDFEIVEKIVCLFEEYNIDAGSRHDF